MSVFSELMAYQRETEALAQVSGRLGWDQETVMPRGAAEQRAEELSAMESVLHARRANPVVGEWLDTAEAEALGDVATAQLRLIRRDFERTTKVPARLAAELARVTSVAQGVWAQARADEDVAAFVPTLERVVALKREEAAALADGGDLYDALLDDYEPGATADMLGTMFGALRPRLVALRERILGAERSVTRLEGEFPEAGQLALSTELAGIFGYDFARGRIDKAVHPFASGSGLDVRITTRTVPRDPFNCLYSTIHETGHATYEQAIDDTFLLTPLGRGASMGVHESQSRICENQLGRSRPFTGWLLGRMREVFGPFGIDDAEAFYAAVNRVHPGYIRTEADEVHYNLHVLMRFDLERQIIAGALEPANLEEAWNTRFEADFGVPVDRPSNGCLQDVHWSVGLFGYFPTYTLGNVYAGCLYDALRRDVSDLDTALGRGETGSAVEWLRDHVQRHGGRYMPRDLIRRAIGVEPTEEPLLAYLEAKFGELYRL